MPKDLNAGAVESKAPEDFSRETIRAMLSRLYSGNFLKVLVDSLSSHLGEPVDMRRDPDRTNCAEALNNLKNAREIFNQFKKLWEELMPGVEIPDGDIDIFRNSDSGIQDSKFILDVVKTFIKIVGFQIERLEKIKIKFGAGSIKGKKCAFEFKGARVVETIKGLSGSGFILIETSDIEKSDVSVEDVSPI
ncbi:MAG: hypothetical protein K9L85_00390 [Candidatus Peribacteraceae bacterium]|nr:hypothetical protein [Candidatus Peribacteraceae bacterium]